MGVGLEAHGASFSAGATVLVAEVNISVQSGRLTAVLGPNGAGKSTLLRMLSGELAPTSGRVTLDGENLGSLSPPFLAQRRAVVPQATQLAFPFTVRDVVAFGVSVPQLESRQSSVQIEVADAIERVGLSELAQRNYTTLSGGERQRVHLARALCQLYGMPEGVGTRVLLLDEPTASLDLGHQLLLMDELREVANDGIAVLAIVHDVNLAARYADDVVLMDCGNVLAAGAPAEVFKSRTLSEAYRCEVEANRAPKAGLPFVLPQVCNTIREAMVSRDTVLEPKETTLAGE
ncbi:MAG: heme ABC transporter ATP-binding protein [Pseudomonadota bacterium]